MRSELSGLLAQPGENVAWLESLMRWLLEAEPVKWGGHSPRTERIRLLNEVLASHPESESLRARIRGVWAHTSAVRLLAETGLPNRTGFWGEALQRLVDRHIPHLDEAGDLYALLERLRLDEGDARWLEGLAPDDLASWKTVLAMPVDAIWDAAQLLSFRAAALGLSRDLLGIAPEARELDSPFGQLPGAISGLRDNQEQADARQQWNDQLAACHARLQAALAHMDEHGVSADMVYRLDLLEIHLRRMTRLVDLAQGKVDGITLAALLIRMGAEQRSMSGLARSTLRRLARKIVEHTSETGEHYVAKTRSEWWKTALAGAGGGALTAFTAAFKYGLGALPFAPMPMGLLLAANYSSSFIAMQFCHFTLASKQPAMTASALAGALENDEDSKVLVDLSAGISRSQVAATLGNVLITIPASLLLDFAWQSLAGHPLLSAEKAAHSLHDLHPFRSLTLPFAALTGVLLWLASLASGWAGNWSAFRQFPEALSSHRGLHRWLGAERATKLAPMIEKHFSGIIGYVALGLLLGFLPVLLAFMGLPVEVRHVTLSAASLALCVGQLWSTGSVPWGDVAWGMTGIALIGVMNFGVSFGLALVTAERARGLAASARRNLASALRGSLLRHPGRFIWPPAD